MQLNDPEQQLKNSLVNSQNRILIPKPLIEIHNTGMASLGDFSAIIGQPKAKKTYLLLLIIAQAINQQSETISFNFDPTRKGIVYFDTEQSKYKTQEFIDRLEKLTDINVDTKIKAYNIREYSYTERTALIEQAIIKHPKASLFIIDGLRDLVKSINDEPEASIIINKLLRWTKIYNIHIIVILHQNKGKTDDNARGHLGTELQNKAETTLIIKKKSDTISQVFPAYTRGKDFHPFTFEINPQGLPILTPTTTKPQLVKSSNFASKPQKIHQQVLKELFTLQPHYKYKDLLTTLPAILNSHDLPTGKNNITAYIKFLKENNLITPIDPTQQRPSYKLGLKQV